MEPDKSNKDHDRTLISLLGVLTVVYLLHQRGKVQDELGRGIREGEAWFCLFLVWSFGASAIAAYLQTFGVQIDIRLLCVVGMLPLFLGLIRFLLADLRIFWLGIALVGTALIFRLLIHLLTGEPF